MSHVPHPTVVGHQATVLKTMVVHEAPHTSAVEGWYLCRRQADTQDRPRDGDKRRQGGPRTGQAQSEVRRGGISNPFILCVPLPLPLRLTAAAPSRGANWRRHSAGRALGRREHLRRGFASSAPGMKDIRNPARLIAGRGPISTPRGALAPLPQPTSQGPSK